MKKLLLTFILMCFCINAAAKEPASDIEKIKEGYINSYFISIAAASCLGVYLPDKSSEFEYLRDYGWEIIAHKEKNNNVETNFSFAHSYFPDIEKDIYLVTFRGSASKKDWQINLKTSKLVYDDKVIPAQLPSDDKNLPSVHEGFINYTDSVLLSSVVDENKKLRGLFKKVSENPNTYMILTGHSLGGAVATLLGERLVGLGMPADKFRVITFGAPAVGNKAFAEQFGSRIDLVRITNTADPVPGSLQTFFGGYQQFGYNYKYHLSPKISEKQHDMAMYFDYSVSEYFKNFDKAAAAGIIKKLPDRKITEGVPLVALWIISSPEIDKLKYIPDIKRLLVNEMKMSMPSYAVMNNPTDIDKMPPSKELMTKSREAGAEYILICGIDGNKVSDQSYWYLTLNQMLIDKNGQLLDMSSFARKVNPEAGNITAAGENIHAAKKELIKKLPFLQTSYQAGIYGF